MATAETDSGIDPGTLANNYMQVMMLQTALSRTESNLNTVPRLIRRIIQEDCWREWLTPDGKHFRWNAADFRRFLESPRPDGCQTPISIVERTLRSTEVWEAFQQLIRGERGNPTYEDQPRTDDGSFMRRNRDMSRLPDDADPGTDVIPFDPEPEKAKRKRDYAREAPTGNSISYAQRRLKTQVEKGDERAKVAYEKFASHEISANRALIEAGIRYPTIDLPLDPQAAIRLIVKRFKDESLFELIRGLANWAGIAIVEPEASEEQP